MTNLHGRLAAGDLVLIDGATGTDLERRGVPMVQNAWCGASALTHPNDVRAVHLAHIEAGAEMIIANTYASSRHLLAWADMEEHFDELNRVGVELAIEARAIAGRPDVAVAGSISTSQQGGEFPLVEVARQNYTDQARILADAGADLIVLEMMRDVEQTSAALDGALSVGLPVWLGLSCDVVDGVPWMWNKTATLADLLLTIEGRNLELIAIMHTETDHVDGCLDVLQNYWAGPTAVYAQSGRFEHPNWIFIDVISPDDYAAACLRWVDRGVQVIGGCCGIGAEHIAHLRPLIDAASRQRR